MTQQNAQTAKLLEESAAPGKGRWWKVELVKNATKDPIKVTLMESQVEDRIALSSALMSARCIATPNAVAEAADRVLAMVGGYAKVVGRYGVKDGEN
jgi:hypothetical protein